MFRENLITLRKLHNISQEELAEKVGISRQTLSKYETGESIPDIEKPKQSQMFLAFHWMTWSIMIRRRIKVLEFHQRASICLD